eukprot:TRINITY_DN10220_c0_g1_i1.p1 TRINITY_DN10220_c0_g1~~TRINITY_DN10220_c0_g1_i1.p1  ORF type:complete len:610 (+),score=122.23 TRINITY_DN10220_c0_g1_i1:30-1859(+)
MSVANSLLARSTLKRRRIQYARKNVADVFTSSSANLVDQQTPTPEKNGRTSEDASTSDTSESSLPIDGLYSPNRTTQDHIKVDNLPPAPRSPTAAHTLSSRSLNHKRLNRDPSFIQVTEHTECLLIEKHLSSLVDAVQRQNSDLRDEVDNVILEKEIKIKEIEALQRDYDELNYKYREMEKKYKRMKKKRKKRRKKRKDAYNILVDPLELMTASTDASEISSEEPLLSSDDITSEEELFGVAFGYKRGKCEGSGCNCEVYDFGVGGQCLNCPHFPAQHQNLGRAEEGEYLRPTTTPRLVEDLDDIDNKTQMTEDIKASINHEWLLNFHDLFFIEKLGRGVAATVFRGTYKEEDEVAIKVLRLEDHQRDLDDFKGELEILSQVRSPYVVHFYGACLVPKLCVVMELCQNGSLYHYLKNTRNELSWDRIIQWMLETARGINSLHLWKPQIVHRDLKTLNILLDESLRIKVCDFGLSRFTTGDNKNLATLGKLRGTYAYTAPELYFGNNFTTKSDVYSMGIIIWEMINRYLNGKYTAPFSNLGNIRYDYQIIHQAATNDLRPTIPELCPDVLRDLIEQCWASESELRPSCTTLIEKLHQIKNSKRRDKWPEP